LSRGCRSVGNGFCQGCKKGQRYTDPTGNFFGFILGFISAMTGLVLLAYLLCPMCLPITTQYFGKVYEQIKQNTNTEHKHFI
jgi:hypothetical protein